MHDTPWEKCTVQIVASKILKPKRCLVGRGHKLEKSYCPAENTNPICTVVRYGTQLSQCQDLFQSKPQRLKEFSS